MKTARLMLVLLTLLGATHGIGQAHGIATPKHGGLVDIGGETTFELVRSGRRVEVFVEDHGKPVDTRGATAELLLGSESGTRLAVLKPSGPNGLAGDSAAFKTGDRVFVRVKFGNGSVEVGEFRIR